ncbi:MAG: N-acetylmuramoyl-L-alanine amidase [Limosilactobacillus gorillae]|nr:N-acetylmuramoyl-L-alanine amidase [Limosilactobacillus gorillae]
MVQWKTITINPEKLNVRTGPGMDYKRIALTKSIHAQVIGQENGWYKIRLANNRTGWVASWLLNDKTNPKASSLAEATIVIDPGHGGSDSGAEYKNSTKKYYMEKTYTLSLAKKVAKDLQAKGARVIMTRNTDRYVGLSPRPKLAESSHANAFISFHFDSSPSANEGTGVTTYYYHTGASKRLASAVNKQFDNLPLRNNGIDFGDFLVIRNNTQPAILCEMGYINTTKDFRQIRRAGYQARVAKDVTTGLENYFKEVQK